jgi:hypothetical protein
MHGIVVPLRDMHSANVCGGKSVHCMGLDALKWVVVTSIRRASSSCRSFAARSNLAAGLSELWLFARAAKTDRVWTY